MNPVPIKVAKKQIGLSDVGLWHVVVAIEPPGTSLRRTEILVNFPELRVWKNAQSKKIIDRAGFEDSRSTVVRVFSGINKIGPTGVSIAGYATGSKEALIAGGIWGILGLVIPNLQQRMPNTGMIGDSEFLPDIVSDGEYYLLSDKYPKANMLKRNWTK